MKSPSTRRYERWTPMGIGSAATAGLLFLLLTNRHLNASPALPPGLLLAIAAAAIGAVLPGGAFNIGLHRQGLAIRAAAAGAFFGVVWLGSPGPLDRFFVTAANG